MRSSARVRTRSAPRAATNRERSGSGVPAGHPVGCPVGRRTGRLGDDRGRIGGRRGHCDNYSSHIPEATGTWMTRGPSPAAIDARSASVSSSRPLTSCGGEAVAARHRGDVETGQVQPGRAADLLEHGEPLEDHVLVVAQDEEGDRRLVGQRAPQRGDPVLSRALAQHAHHRPRRLGQLHADGRGDPEAQAAAGAEVVAAGRRDAQPVAQRQRARRRLQHDDRRRR